MSRAPEVIVALDFPDPDSAWTLVERLPTDTWYKVGLELFTRGGPPVVERLVREGRNVFLDLKLHDIPNTVAGAVRSASRLGARLLTVHASGGEAMLRAAAEAADATGSDGRLRLLAITVLTSLDDEALRAVMGPDATVELGFPAQPRYIAAWVQGPGTVWLDDLSLREAVPPALSLSLDQPEYDSLDRVGVATVDTSRLMAPASVRLVLASASGEAVGTLSVPFRPQDEVAAEPNGLLSLVAPANLNSCRLVLKPANLPAGDYVLTVALLDAQGAALGEASTRFRRLPG